MNKKFAFRRLTQFESAFIRELHSFGGVCLGLYAAAYNSIGLIDSETYERDIEAILSLKKGSIDVKTANVILLTGVRRSDN